MAIIIPALFFGALIWLLAGAGRGGLRQCFVYAAAVYTLCLVFATEVFSAGGLLRVETLAVFYGALAVAAGVYARLYGDRQAVLQALRNVQTRFMEFPAVLSAAGLVLAIVLLIALVSPPNNWDSMTYHMSRVAMWVQQESVAHYPTPYLVQNSHPPLAEWNILHFQILSGGDRFANAVQWLYLFGCGIAASLIARECKAAFPVQALAAVIAVTLPMALLQGSSTQNDVAGSFWILSFTLFVIQYLKAPRLELLLLGGLTAGFALLTKGTLYVILPPVALSLLVYGLTRPKVRAMRIKLLPAAAAILALALVLNVGHYSRNFASFGNPLVPDRNQSQTVDEFGPLVTPFVIYSNLVRNSALHWNVPSYELNWDIMQLMRGVFGDGLESVEGSTVGGGGGRHLPHRHFLLSTRGLYRQFPALLGSAAGGAGDYPAKKAAAIQRLDGGDGANRPGDGGLFLRHNQVSGFQQPLSYAAVYAGGADGRHIHIRRGVPHLCRGPQPAAAAATTT